jgi:cytoskeletal protein RodZ
MRKLFTAVALSLVLAVGLWFGLMGTASAQHHAPRAHSHVSAAHHSGHAATAKTHKASSSHAKTKSASTDPSGESSGESSGETSGESGSSNEPSTDTHEDPAGQDVNHECPPNCDTANGEQP